MSHLYIVGGGLFGSLAARYARSQGVEAVVFDVCREGAASPAAAGLFQEKWAARKLRPHYYHALPLLERLFNVRHISLKREDGSMEPLLFIPPSNILEPNPIRLQVTSVGDGWLEAGGQRYEGWVYIAAGIWSAQFLPGLESLFITCRRDGADRANRALMGQSALYTAWPFFSENRVSDLARHGRQKTGHHLGRFLRAPAGGSRITLKVSC
jgi:hypothetical protein